MKKQTIRLMIALSLLVGGTVCTLTVRSQDSVKKDAAFDLASLKSQIANYKSWTAVNPQPAKMSPVVSMMCARATTSSTSNAGVHSANGEKYLRVYVNDVGRDAMFQPTHPRFPLGTIIVKEKLASIDSPEAEFYTIMVKRESNYDPAHGNWQYLTMSSNRSSPEAPKNVASCQACHDIYRDMSDCVTRAYLPSR